jgi:hypothetical protein
MDSADATRLLHKLQTMTVCVTMFQFIPNATPMLMFAFNDNAPAFAALHYAGGSIFSLTIITLTV